MYIIIVTDDGGKNRYLARFSYVFHLVSCTSAKKLKEILPPQKPIFLTHKIQLILISNECQSLINEN